jgi:hypothetical protein
MMCISRRLLLQSRSLSWSHEAGVGGQKILDKRGMKMDRRNGINCPRMFASQLEDMIAYADSQQDFALAAWLSQALDRLMESHVNP